MEITPFTFDKLLEVHKAIDEVKRSIDEIKRNQKQCSQRLGALKNRVDTRLAR